MKTRIVAYTLILSILCSSSFGSSHQPILTADSLKSSQRHGLSPIVSMLKEQNHHHLPREKMTQSGLTQCVDYDTDFSKEMNGWIPFDSDGDTFSQVGDGMQLELVPPSEYIRLVEVDTNLPYNGQPAKGATFASEFYMHYGRVSATMRASPVGGSITAFILMSDNGDEVDFEFLGGDANQVQTNYFYAGEELFTVNGGLHKVDGAAVFDDFHTYTIDWSPDRIQWLVDGQVVRVKEKIDTCQSGICKYPSSPARIQYGLWDSSFDAGTAQWARGPIDWSDPSLKANAIIRHISVSCDPNYNDVFIYS